MMIEPDKCIVEDLEILAFENEEQLNFYTIWHEALVDKRREANASSERERQVIRNEIARKKRQMIWTVIDVEETSSSNTGTSKASKSSKVGSHIVTASGSTSKERSATAASSSKKESINTFGTSIASHSSKNIKESSASISNVGVTNASESTSIRTSSGGLGKILRVQSGHKRAQATLAHQRCLKSPNLPSGLTILNSTHFNTMPDSKLMMKYKLTKLYNKYRGRQLRRNFVNEKQRNARIEVEIGKSYLNSWLAYTALQALRLPETNYSLNATTTGNSKILTPMTQPPVTTVSPTKKTKTPFKKQQQQQFNKPSPQIPQAQQSQPQMQQPQQPPQQFKPPMHLVYIDPSNIITYSNRINPQQVAEYRQKSHLLPSSATSKKSSAASYDAYEIMEVLANTNKTHVTITRNANRPSQTGTAASIYSHSVNATTPGIVSTQLHLQARSYLDMMSRFYAEEFKRLEKEKEDMEHEPSSEEMISRYLNDY